MQKYYLIGGTPLEPVGFGGFRALSDFRVRGTREAGERWWGLAALSNARVERGGGGTPRLCVTETHLETKADPRDNSSASGQSFFLILV